MAVAKQVVFRVLAACLAFIPAMAYFAPILSRVPEGNKPGANPYQVDVFRGYPALEVVNTPKEYLSQVPASELPAFWLAAGAQDKSDVSTAENFRQLLLARLAKVPMLIVLGGGHQGSVWRTALGPMLSWMTPFLAGQAANADAARRAARNTESHPERSTATPGK